MFPNAHSRQSPSLLFLFHEMVKPYSPFLCDIVPKEHTVVE